MNTPTSDELNRFHDRKWSRYYVLTLLIFLSFPLFIQWKGEVFGFWVGAFGFFSIAVVNYLKFHFPPACLSCGGRMIIASRGSSYWTYRCSSCGLSYEKKRMILKSL